MKPNLIFVLLDGSRWDRIHTSKEFSNLIKSGTFMNNVSTAFPYTFGALNVILTGLYGKENGVDGYYRVKDLKDDVDFLPEILHNAKYYTVKSLIHEKVLSDRGFDEKIVDNEFEDDQIKQHTDLLKKLFQKNQPFFCFLQSAMIHTETVSKVLKKFDWDDQNFYDQKNKNMEIYDKAFHHTGIYANKIFQTVLEANQLDNTLIIFFTDHGTGIGERFGERNYGSFTFEETIRTFCLFVGFGIKNNQTYAGNLANIDLFSTILKILNLQSSNKSPGIDHSTYLLHGSPLPSTTPTFSETGALHGPFPSPEKSNVFCIKSDHMKLIYYKSEKKWELFNLKNDPNETKNIYGQEIEQEKILKKQLLDWITR